MKAISSEERRKARSLARRVVEALVVRANEVSAPSTREDVLSSLLDRGAPMLTAPPAGRAWGRGRIWQGRWAGNATIRPGTRPEPRRMGRDRASRGPIAVLHIATRQFHIVAKQRVQRARPRLPSCCVCGLGGRLDFRKQSADID